MSKWYESNIIDIYDLSIKDRFLRLRKAFNQKYGDFDYKNDLRTKLHKQFSSKFKKLLKALNIDKNSKVLICGVNNSNEPDYFNIDNLTVLDISDIALKNLKQRYPGIKTINADIHNMPLDKNSFDLVLCLRTLQSNEIDVKTSILEFLRVLKDTGTVITSLPNGYYDADTKSIIRGMYNPAETRLEKNKPFELYEEIQKVSSDLNISISKIIDMSSEIVFYFPVGK